MARWSLHFVLVLGACNAPTPHFYGAEVTRISVHGSTFDIRQRGRLAEAIRVNTHYAPRLGPVAERAAIAMQLATGCEVLEIRGDAALVLGILDCGDSTGGVPRASYVPTYQDCDVADIWVPSGADTAYLEVEC